ncbi:MAG TPA: DUF488 domain-containing protein [Thermoanaerobaculia bacterium]|nr:DUF488 domain-containing protein [Thermoanaerobaculia bacterium]
MRENDPVIDLYTIGFTGTSAANFFGRLRRAKIERLIDVRLNNVSQLAGFAKKNDLAFFLREICDADYVHELLLAPRDEDLKAVRAGKLSWDEYETRYAALLRERGVESTLDRSLFDRRCVLLCSEAKPAQCHRRIAAEYLKDAWGDVAITHL